MSRSYSNNPDKRSSGYDFYIVTGRKIGAQELGRIQQEKGRVYTREEAEIYARQGGAPHLDGEHTVFGRVLEGMDVIDRLAATPRRERLAGGTIGGEDERAQRAPTDVSPF